MFTIKAKAILYGKELQVKNANIIIENSKISKITNSKETKGRVIEADLCMPGLINAHTHIADFFLFGKIQERINHDRKLPNSRMGIQHIFPILDSRWYGMVIVKNMQKITSSTQEWNQSVNPGHPHPYPSRDFAFQIE